MSQGWVKLHRSLLDWEWFDDANCTRLFLYCLLKANHKDQKWKGLEIKRGSFFTGLDSLKSETGLTVSQIRTVIRKLEMTGELTSKSQAGGRMITVVAYDRYQGDDKQNDTIIAEGSQDDDKRVTANKNDKKEKNEENEKNINTSQKPKVVCPHNEILNLWDEVMPSHITRHRASLWRNNPGYNNLKQRWEEMKKYERQDGKVGYETQAEGLEFWRHLFNHLTNSDFMMNEWKPSLADILVKSKFYPALEGKYHASRQH